MIEPLFSEGYRTDPSDTRPVEDFFDVPQIAAARASVLALESALTHGVDMPCGAVAVNGSQVVGRGFAGDKRLGLDEYHAEISALLDASVGSHSGAPAPDSLVVTFEPCGQCQSIIPHQCPELKKVYYAIGREELEERGLVKVRSKIYDEPDNDLYEQLPDGPAARMNRILLDYVDRNLATGEVSVDVDGLRSNYDGTPFSPLDLMKIEAKPTSPFVNASYLGLMATSGYELHRLAA